MLLTADPGTGKSYVIDVICHLAELFNLGYVGTTSYNGIAAVNVDGNTVSSMFGIFDASDTTAKETLDRDSLMKMREKLQIEKMCFFDC